MKRTGMAAQFTEVTLDEMEKTLQRAFHALHPRKGALKGEVVIDLFLSEKAGVRVWTSISERGTSGAGVGQDALRVQLYNFAKGRPMKPGKAPIVKRTQGWKDNLRERVEDEIESYDTHEEDIEAGKFINW
jgi:hypothetical protein